MEMSCDEAVLRQLGPGIRADYSQSLLRLASGQRVISFAPLAFGEGDTKGRVLNMLKWKKPKLWISTVCVVLSLAVLAACAVNPSVSGGPKDQGVVNFGHMTVAVPPQYTHGDSEQGGVSIYEDEILVGGIERYKVPDGVVAEELDPHELGVSIGIPDSLIENLAYFGSGSAWADMEIEYFDELEPETLNRSHHFYIVGWHVYDFWFDNNRVAPDGQTALLAATEVAPAEEVTEQQYDETEPAEDRYRDDQEYVETRVRALQRDRDLERCRQILELIQGSESWWILDEQINKPVNDILNDSSVKNFLRSGEDWLTVFQIPDGGDMAVFAYMRADGSYYDNLDNSGVTGSPEIIWSRAEEAELTIPWLVAYQWNADDISDVSVSSDGLGEGITLQIDALYPGVPESSADYCPYPSYTVTFWFDWEGAFRYVETKRSLMELRDGDYHFLNKESIVTLDDQTVSDEIGREHSKAVQ